MKRKKVLLGFSGGVDSCASVELLRADGYDVTALFLDVMHDQKLIYNACYQADRLGVELIIDDVAGEFKQKIIDYFFDEYMQGHTPAPCTRCNPEIKWRRLEQIADQQGYDYIATGHYFRVEQQNGRFYVGVGADSAKDQSYYLWGLNQSTLARIITPMGDKIKSKLSPQKNQRESMGVCFLSGKSYGELIRERAGILPKGKIVDKLGTIVGVHDGYPLYTIGQKRGLTLFDQAANGGCIIDINATLNQLTLGQNEDLFHHHIVLRDCNIVDIEDLITTNNATIKIRGYGQNPEGRVQISINKQSSQKSVWLDVELENPAWAVAKGQPAVIYYQGRVLGGGYVENYF